MMQHVPVWDRLGSCCLVSRKLHAAAIAVTDQLQIPYRPERLKQLADSALAWMGQFGQQLTSVRWYHVPYQPLRTLPCPNLLQLHVGYDCYVQLGPSGAHRGVIAGCTKLTGLELQGGIIDAGVGAVVDSLSSLVHLQHLYIEPSGFDRMPYSLGGLSEATLPRLQHLTYLNFKRLSVDNLLQLDGLTNLQELHLSAALKRGTAVGPSTVPGLSFPSFLQKLVLVSLVEAGVLSLVPTGLLELRVPCRVEGLA